MTGAPPADRPGRRAPTLLWMECGACSGESMAILGADGRGKSGETLPGFLAEHDVELLWHPSLSLESPREAAALFDRIDAGEQHLTLLCVEGSIIHGPNGSGRFDTFEGRAKRDLVRALCERADYVLAMGSCASFGGIPAAGIAPHAVSAVLEPRARALALGDGEAARRPRTRPVDAAQAGRRRALDPARAQRGRTRRGGAGAIGPRAHAGRPRRCAPRQGRRAARAAAGAPAGGRRRRRRQPLADLPAVREPRCETDNSCPVDAAAPR